MEGSIDPSLASAEECSAELPTVSAHLTQLANSFTPGPARGDTSRRTLPRYPRRGGASDARPKSSHAPSAGEQPHIERDFGALVARAYGHGDLLATKADETRIGKVVGKSARPGLFNQCKTCTPLP